MKFKKLACVICSILLFGALAGFAVATTTYPLPFVQNGEADVAIVYGANSAPSDLTAANKISNNLKSIFDSFYEDWKAPSGDFSSSVGITDEIELGQVDIIQGKLRLKLEDNKIPTLLDTKVYWDNGDGEESYDVHEEILLTDKSGKSELKLVTNLNHPDGEDLDSFVVLQNDKSLRYRLVFDDLIEFSSTNEDDAEGLKVSILGKEYEITDFNDGFDKITISLSKEEVVKEGTVLNVEGTTLTVGTIFDKSVEVNGVLVKEEGSIEKIDGVEVQVISTATHSDSTLSKAIVRVGKDIKKVVNNGDEYVKGDETWEWDIGFDEGKQYIGVKYTLRNVAYDEDEPEENPISVGQSYVFPENYAALSFIGLTDVTYEDFELSFDDEDLYAGNSSTKQDNVDVAILKGENDDSITLMYNGSEIETDSLYFKYVPSEVVEEFCSDENFSNKEDCELNGSVWTEETETVPNVEIYFKDIDGDVDSDHEGRIQFADNVEDMKLVVGDTEIGVSVDAEKLTLTNTNGKVISIPLNITGNEFTHLGVKPEDAEAEDIVVDDTSIGTKDYDVMDNYGVIILNPEDYADDDRVVLSVPSEQVYATISVLGQGKEIVDNNVPQLGSIIVKDTEVSSVSSKNLIVVGGSCINTVAAKLLGVPEHTCGEAFTVATGVGAGSSWIEQYTSPYNSEKVALLVAGFEAADTTSAADSLLV